MMTKTAVRRVIRILFYETSWESSSWRVPILRGVRGGKLKESKRHPRMRWNSAQRMELVGSNPG